MLWKLLAVDLHDISCCCCTSPTDGDVGKRFSSLVSFARDACNHPGSRIILIQSGTQLLASLCQLFLQSECFKHNRVPLGLESGEK